MVGEFKRSDAESIGGEMIRFIQQLFIILFEHKVGSHHLRDEQSNNDPNG